MKKALKIIGYIFLINFVITQTIDTYSNPDYTKTRVFLRTPKTYLWNFAPEAVENK